MADMSSRAETELRIDDDYLDANAGDATAVIDCVHRTPAEAFINAHLTVPSSGAGTTPTFNIRYISVNQGQQDAAATFANVNRALLNDGAGRQTVRRYACGVLHAESVNFIYPAQTTGRGISVYS